jgi:purine-nucleoside phosphorylase
MTNFESLFGQSAQSIQKTCVLSPIMHRRLLEGFGIPQLLKGSPYSSFSRPGLTVIHSYMGTTFTGDAVLYLKDTPCENLILFGSCGLVQKTPALDIGSLVSPSQVVVMESFSSLLKHQYHCPRLDLAKPNSLLLSRLKKLKPDAFQVVTGATFGSLALEDSYHDRFIKRKIEIVEMEASAFFLAAQRIKKHAAALFYVTDILGETNPYPQSLLHEDQRVQTAIKTACALIQNLAHIV